MAAAPNSAGSPGVGGAGAEIERMFAEIAGGEESITRDQFEAFLATKVSFQTASGVLF